jgi:hypothetical protein
MRQTYYANIHVTTFQQIKTVTRFQFNSLGHRTPQYQNDVLDRGQRVRVVGRADRRLPAARRRRPARRAGPRPRHARAMAHLGVLRRARVTVSCVAGTSGGGVIGAMLASGLDEELLVDRFVGVAGSELYSACASTFRAT